MDGWMDVCATAGVLSQLKPEPMSIIREPALDYAHQTSQAVTVRVRVRCQGKYQLRPRLNSKLIILSIRIRLGVSAYHTVEYFTGLCVMAVQLLRQSANRLGHRNCGGRRPKTKDTATTQSGGVRQIPLRLLRGLCLKLSAFL